MSKEIPLFNNSQVPRPQMQIKASDLKDITCDECESKVFREATMFKRLSALVSPTGKEQIVPLPIFRCDECGNINAEFLPNSEK